MGSCVRPSCITIRVMPAHTTSGTAGELRSGCGSCNGVKDIHFCLPLMAHGQVVRLTVSLSESSSYIEANRKDMPLFSASAYMDGTWVLWLLFALKHMKQLGPSGLQRVLNIIIPAHVVILPTVTSSQNRWKIHADFVHYSNMSWMFLKIFERNRAENFLKAVPSLILLLVHHQVSFCSISLNFPGTDW